MRRRLTSLCIALVAVPATAALVAAPGASAQCPGNDATLPGTPSRTLTVHLGPETIYIDDRDYLDYDEDGDAGGIWIYRESNGHLRLQRGGNQTAFVLVEDAGVDPVVPYVGPTPVGPFTLFPNGFGGGNLAEIAGSHDDCVQAPASRADEIIF